MFLVKFVNLNDQTINLMDLQDLITFSCFVHILVIVYSTLSAKVIHITQYDSHMHLL